MNMQTHGRERSQRARMVKLSASILLTLLFQAAWSALPARAELAWSQALTAPSGDGLNELVEGPDGALYTTARTGGPSNQGTVLRVRKSGAVSVLYAFDGSQGAAPRGGLTVGRDGNLYGTTSAGGPNGYGTAFRITTSGTLTTLHAFTLAEGGGPQAALIQASDGNFYGTSAGVYGNLGTPPQPAIESHGAVFRMTPTGEVTVLHAFSGATDGAQPRAQLIQARDGHLYGTTSALQVTAPVVYNISWGTVFRITLEGAFSSLYTFRGSDGGNPTARLLEDAEGYLYGTTGFATQQRGPGTTGTVFRITPSGTLTTLHRFESGAEGRILESALVPSPDGGFYGTTQAGGAENRGTLFRIAPDGALTVVRAFQKGEGEGPWYLLRTASGEIYGASRDTVLRTSARSTRVLARVGFEHGTNPIGFFATRDGSTFAVTTQRGEFGYGAILRVGPRGVSTFYAFRRRVGGDLDAGPSIVEGADGALYGLFEDESGAIFRLTRRGDLRILHRFVPATDGEFFESQLFTGQDGNIYSAASGGGAYGDGTFFRVTPGGAFAVLYSFGGPANPAAPPGTPVPGSDGTFFVGESDTILRRLSSGATLNVRERLEYALGPDGALYAGDPGRDTIVRRDVQGATTTFYDFADNLSPRPQVVFGADRSLFGTTVVGGVQRAGSIFRLAPDGVLTTLHSFEPSIAGSVDYVSVTGLVRVGGSAYGATYSGGPNGAGTLFRIDVP